MARYIYQGVEPTTKNTSTWQDSHSDLTELSRQAKVKRIQNHQTSFITNAKGTSLGSKQNKKIRLTENKLKTINKLVIGTYISIITLTKHINKTGWLDENACMHFHLSL